jgi:4-amino-4-deoxy-L-arabinose transferase-like glycosyltransferase
MVAALVVISMAATILAMRRTSATFDEIAPIAVGAYGWNTGDWDRMTRFPPVMQYLYGIPGYLSKPNYPSAFGADHYTYARALLWQSGNDAEALIFRARLVTALFVGALVLITFFFARTYFDEKTALLAAALVAFLPDVLAHGGIAYNDLPLATMFLAALWAIDRSVRNPSIASGAVAGLLASLALGIKHSAFVLGPIAVVLIILEALTRSDRRKWLPRIAGAFGIGLLAGYATQVVLYRGDIMLLFLRDGTNALAEHVSQGHAVPDPRGAHAADATWTFYPRVLLLKTPIAFQLLLLLGLAGGLMALQSNGRTKLLAGPARVPLVGVILFAAALLQSKLVIGFRYALPVLPLLAILAASGCMYFWSRGRGIRAVIVGLALWCAASTLSFYPYFIAYSSEYPPDRDHAYEELFDSSLDWGQGLIALREFMREENVDNVYLAYFGSALPEGYGIKYVRLPSFFTLPPQPPAASTPKFAVVSATLLGGRYVMNDAYRDPREKLTPYRILGHTMYVYQVQ